MQENNKYSDASYPLLGSRQVEDTPVSSVALLQLHLLHSNGHAPGAQVAEKV